jgi:hypothetical protein
MAEISNLATIATSSNPTIYPNYPAANNANISPLREAITSSLGPAIAQTIGSTNLPAAIESAVCAMVKDAVGEAVKLAVDKLLKEYGMPKFLAGDITKTIATAPALALTSPPASAQQPAVNAAVNGNTELQNWRQDFIKSLTDNMVAGVTQNLQAIEGKESSPKSWLQALAAAMGSVLGQKASKMVELSNKMSSVSKEGTALSAQAKEASTMTDANAKKVAETKVENDQKTNASEFTKTQTELQAVSQELSMLQSSFSNAIKSIGEALSQMGRKG